MARPLRIAFPGGIYHVTSRGDRQEPIFTDDRDRATLLRVLAQAMDRFDARVLAYCLMGNHYHLVTQTRRDNLSRLMRHINGVYAQSFNRRHQLAGHLFQGRFTSIHVDRDAYLMEVCRYTELNPVRAGLVGNPADWPWSSYLAHCGITQAPPWLDVLSLHGHLLGRDPQGAEDCRLAAMRYAQLVADGQGVRLWDRALRQTIFLGDDKFVDAIQRRIDPASEPSPEVPRAQRRAPGVPIDWSGADGSSESMVRRAYVDGGLLMREIAAALGCSVSRVSRVIKRAEGDESARPAVGPTGEHD